MPQEVDLKNWPNLKADTGSRYVHPEDIINLLIHTIMQNFWRSNLRLSLPVIPTFMILFLLCITGTASGTEDSTLVWNGMEDNVNTLFLRHRRNGVWLEPKKFISNEIINTPPIVVTDKQQRDLVVWTIREQDSARLAFRLIEGDVVTQPDFIKPPLRYAMAPHMAVDSSGVVWLTFSGSNGDDDDIYVSSWSNGKWTPPQMVNEDDDLPDVLPLIGVDRSGEVWVRWPCFDGDRYQQCYSEWSGQQWGPEQVISTNDALYDSINARLGAAKTEIQDNSCPDSAIFFFPESEIQVWSSIYKQMYSQIW